MRCSTLCPHIRGIAIVLTGIALAAGALMTLPHPYIGYVPSVILILTAIWLLLPYLLAATHRDGFATHEQDAIRLAAHERPPTIRNRRLSVHTSTIAARRPDVSACIPVTAIAASSAAAARPARTSSPMPPMSPASTTSPLPPSRWEEWRKRQEWLPWDDAAAQPAA